MTVRTSLITRQIVCETPARRIAIGWISLQPDGSISFGLNDRTFISPRFKVVHGVWSVFNRRKAHYGIESDPKALESVENLHFTYHPPARFHLKDNLSRKEEALFLGIADLELTLRQDGRMRWIRAISAPVVTLKSMMPKLARDDPDPMLARIFDENLSIWIELDFLDPTAPHVRADPSTWSLHWHGVTLRVRIMITHPGPPLLSWFHFW